MEKIQIKLMEHTPFVKEDGTFDKEKALMHGARIAGVCYSKEGFETLKSEPEETTQKRMKGTLKLEHHSVYDHVNIGLEIKNIPKIMAMILNNEKQYNTSEKSARYTPVVSGENSVITKTEQDLYDKWQIIFEEKIKEQYGDVYNDEKIEKLAHENARYLVTVFMPTEMIYTVPYAQLNKIVDFMKRLLVKENPNMLEERLVPYIIRFLSEIDKLNLSEELLQSNRKNRDFSLIGQEKKRENFNYTYVTSYKGTFAQLAQSQRHRTLDYEMFMLEDQEFYVPPIIEDDEKLKKEWLLDMEKVGFVFPQGQMIEIIESGNLDNFILKAKERLCVSAQLEIFNQVRETMKKYHEELSQRDQILSKKLYKMDLRCQGMDYKCAAPCKQLKSKIKERKV